MVPAYGLSETKILIIFISFGALSLLNTVLAFIRIDETRHNMLQSFLTVGIGFLLGSPLLLLVGFFIYVVSAGYHSFAYLKQFIGWWSLLLPALYFLTVYGTLAVIA